MEAPFTPVSPGRHPRRWPRGHLFGTSIISRGPDFTLLFRGPGGSRSAASCFITTEVINSPSPQVAESHPQEKEPAPRSRSANRTNRYKAGRLRAVGPVRRMAGTEPRSKLVFSSHPLTGPSNMDHVGAKWWLHDAERGHGNLSSGLSSAQPSSVTTCRTIWRRGERVVTIVRQIFVFAVLLFREGIVRVISKWLKRPL